MGAGPTLTTSSDLSHLQVQPRWGSGLLCGPGTPASLTYGAQMWLHRHLLPQLQPTLLATAHPLAEDSSPGAGSPVPQPWLKEALTRGLSPGCASAPRVLWRLL